MSPDCAVLGDSIDVEPQKLAYSRGDAQGGLKGLLRDDERKAGIVCLKRHPPQELTVCRIHVETDGGCPAFRFCEQPLFAASGDYITELNFRGDRPTAFPEPRTEGVNYASLIAPHNRRP